MFDGKAFGEEIVGMMQDYVERKTAALKAENDELKARIKALEDRPEPELLEAEPIELPDFDSLVQDAINNASDDWAPQITTDERAILIAAMLRKEIGSDELFNLPDLPPLAQASPQPTTVIHNHLPSKGREKTVVTKHDDRGRIIEFERFEQ